MIKKIKIKDDFDLEKIAQSGQSFRWKRLDDGFLILSRDKYLKIRDLGSQEYEFNTSDDDLSYWYEYFDLNRNYSELIRSLKSDDQFINHCLEEGKNIRILKQDPWETLITFILSQRKSLPALYKDVNRLAEVYGKPTGIEEAFFFPTPEELAVASVEDFRNLKLGYRSKYVKSAANYLRDTPDYLDKLNNLEDSELLKELKKFEGVGDKVANCVLLFGYNRLNAFPQDTWILKIMDKFYNNEYNTRKFYPYNGIIQQYMFYSYRKENMIKSDVF